MPFPARLRTAFKLEPVLLTLVLVLLLGGFVILASASITISDNATGNPFFYLERQLIAAAIGIAAGAFCLFVPMKVWQSLGFLMLLVGIGLLALVLVGDPVAPRAVAEVEGHAAGEQTQARGDTDRVGAVGLVEPDTRRGDVVHGRRVQVSVAGTRHGAAELLVGHDEEDVWSFFLYLILVDRTARKKTGQGN